jgi:LmbE family N-acetylglucosaminyl deacetylase
VVSPIPVITDPSELGTILGVWGHPDDEAYVSAGLMMGALEAGNRAVCVTATRGEAGFADDDPRSSDERATVREAELAACFEILGVTEHRWLHYPDGRCDQIPDHEPVGRLAAILEEVRPDTVLTFDPFGQTGHVDHIAASRWTTLACRRVLPDVRLLYAVMTPEWVADFMDAAAIESVMMVDDMEPPTVPVADLSLWHQLDAEHLDRKVRALRAQASQVEPLVQQVGLDRFAAFNRDETFRLATADDWAAPSS